MHTLFVLRTEDKGTRRANGHRQGMSVVQFAWNSRSVFGKGGRDM
jgi:hypothetical protein